ncbi:MAG: accessory factor UbiK family protein [Halioglobus sp.]|nr:accessory factor UbiK family protein [Halioglobus sp.]
MATKSPPPPWEVARQVGDLVGAAGVRREVDRGVRALAQSALTRLDVVSRDEFDAQTEVLRRTRDRVAALEMEVAELASALEELGKQHGGA